MKKKQYNPEEIKVGLYVFIAFIVLLGFTLSISHQSGMGPKKLFYTDFNFVNGIERGAVVRFAGMKVGSVTDVFISPDDPAKIRVAFEVRDDIPIKETSVVTINAIGVMGDYYLEILPGTSNSKIVKEKTILASLDISRLDELFRNFDLIAQDVRKITATLSQSIDSILDEEAREHLKRIIISSDSLIKHLNVLAGNLNNITGEENQKIIKDAIGNINDFTKILKERADKTLGAIENLALRLDRITANNEREIEKIIRDLHITISNLEEISSSKKEDIKAIIANLKKSTEHIEEVIRKNSGNINDTLYNIRVASYNARNFTKKISLYPWTLIWKGKMEPNYRPKAER